MNTTYTQYHKDNFLKLRDYMRDVVIPQCLSFEIQHDYNTPGDFTYADSFLEYAS